MFEHIVVPVDLAGDNRSTIEVATDLAEHHGSKVTLLHVIETVQDTTFEEFSDFYEKIERRAAGELEEVEKPFAEREIPTTRAIVYGRRIQEILGYARAEGANLLLLKSHAPDADPARPRWDSISHAVAVLASCPVLLVK